MANSTLLRILNSVPENEQVLAGSHLSDLFVCNSDALTAQTDPDDPHEIIKDTGSNGLKVFPVPGMGAKRLHLYLVCGHASSTPAPTPATVRAYGRKLVAPAQKGSRFYPWHVNSTVFDDVAANDVVTSLIGAGYYVPLYQDEEGSTKNSQTFSASPEITQDATGKRFTVSGGVSYLVKGTSDILVSVNNAAAGSNVTAAVILGCLEW